MPLERKKPLPLPKTVKMKGTRRDLHKYLDTFLDSGMSVLVGGQCGAYGFIYHGRKVCIVSLCTKIIEEYKNGTL